MLYNMLCKVWVMEKISSAKLAAGIGAVLDRVLRSGPVMVTRYNRDLIVLVSAEDYEQLTTKAAQYDAREWPKGACDCDECQAKFNGETK